MERWKNNNKREYYYNSFFKLSITYNMDGRDDEKFEFSHELNDLDSIYDNIEILNNDIEPKNKINFIYAIFLNLI